MEREIKESIRQDLWEKFLRVTNAREEIPIISRRLLKNRQSPYPYIRKTCAQIKMEFKNERSGCEKGE